MASERPNQQPSFSSDEEISLESLLNSDGERSVIDSRLSLDNPQLIVTEKKKGKPTLRNSLEQIYSNPTENSPKLMESLHKATDQFTQLNSELRSAKSEYLGCKTLLDTFYYGPAIADMVIHLTSHDASWGTFPEAALASFVGSLFVLLGNMVIIDEDGKSNTSSDKATWNIYSKDKARVKELTINLAHQTKIIKAHMKFLGLTETEEIKKPHQISEVVDTISTFFDDKAIEEEVLRKTNSKS